jgi:hypothetical protein
MELSEVKAYLDEHKTDPEVAEYLRGMNPLSGLTKDTVKDFVGQNPLLKSYNDQIANIAVDTFKEKFETEEVPKLVQNKYDEAHPPESEEAKRLRTLETTVETEKKARVKAELRTIATEAATENGLPQKLVKFFVGDNEESTNENLKVFKEVFDSAVQSGVEEKMKTSAREPHQNDISNVKKENPFSKEHFNMFKQIQLKKTNPALHDRLKAEAGVAGA